MPSDIRCQFGNSAPLASLNDNVGRFSRPLLEGYWDCQNQYRIIAKSLAVADVKPLLLGISAYLNRSIKEDSQMSFLWKVEQPRIG